MSIESFGSPILSDIEFNQDGSLKQSGKQNIKFYNKKILTFKAKPLLSESGEPLRDGQGKIRFDIDPKTGLPKKEAVEEILEFVRVETKGDTNVFDNVATDIHKRQFYRQYKHFREGKVPDGNPIEDFEFLQPQTIMELHMLGIHVIQQVADMSDIECEQLKDQSGYEIRDIAAQWVKINTPQGQAMKASKLESELMKLRREVAELKGGRRYQPMAEGEPMQQEELIESQPDNFVEFSAEELAEKRRGRPRKVQ